MAQVSGLPMIRLDMSLTVALGVVQLDPWLAPFKDGLRSRFSKAQNWLKTIDEAEGGLEKFSRVRLDPSHSGSWSNERFRASRSLASSSTIMGTSPTVNGRRMQWKPVLLESSV